MTKFCGNCGEPISNENAIVCSDCGKPISEDASYHSDGQNGSSNEPKAAPDEKTTASPVFSPTQTKSPILALILSFFWTGLGQVYNGKTWKGVFFVFAIPIGLVFLIIPGVVVWVWCLWDAYADAEKMNKGEIPYAEPTAAGLIGFICLPFFIAFGIVAVFLLFFTALVAF